MGSFKLKTVEQVLKNIRQQKVSHNPFITNLYTADPAAHAWQDGRLYVYASRDLDMSMPENSNCDFMDNYHVFSTDDMVNWIDEGEILNSDDLDWGIEHFMWAPDAAYKNGKYYFYYPHPDGTPRRDHWKIGVAVSDQPASGFKDAGFLPGGGEIDPSVFVDDDGRAYIYCGNVVSGPKQGELTEDMLHLQEPMTEIEGLEDFHEAIYVFKWQNKYYLTYSNNRRGQNQMCYAWSDSPLGPWTYQGVYLEPVGCETSHGSIVQYQDQWWVLYHNDAVSKFGSLRSICCDPLEFDEAGHMKTVIQSKSGRIPIQETHSFDHESLLVIRLLTWRLLLVLIIKRFIIMSQLIPYLVAFNILAQKQLLKMLMVLLADELKLVSFTLVKKSSM